jgi:hypothetical protein
MRQADDVKSAAVLASALDRWRGPMLAGVPHGPVLTARCAAVEEERLVVVEELALLQLRLDRPGEAARLLRDHTQLHPLRERAHALLMRALSESGDAAGALGTYAAARKALKDELGIDPGIELQRIHRTVLLNRDREPPPPQVAKVTTVPACWLPRAIDDFTGRADVLARIVAVAERVRDSPIIELLDGMAGSGKTTLAVQAAYRLAGKYPDAQLFIDLQGHSKGRPLDPGTALVTLLRQLGVPAGRIPPDLEGRVALWHAELAPRRVIVVLDNVATSDQVSPLLPVSGRAVALVTSRRRLSALDGVRPESLAVMSPDEAMELLAKIVGLDLVESEPVAAEEVVRRCGHLPRAIRLAAARLAHRPAWRVADLARRLQAESAILSELAVENRDLGSAFALSYGPLSHRVRRMFRLLGLWPGEHIGVAAAAALGDMSLLEAESVGG